MMSSTARDDIRLRYLRMTDDRMRSALMAVLRGADRGELIAFYELAMRLQHEWAAAQAPAEGLETK